MKRPKGFSRYIVLARSYLKDSQTLSRFLTAVGEYAKSKKHLIKDFRGNLQTLINLLKAWITGTYTDIPRHTVLLVTAALLYFLSPLDTIPDFLGPLGFTDDATVILFVLSSLRTEIDRYKQWCKRNNRKE
jgi:uncharacterized membrane protein YkvA (DUF1232 family)